MSYAVNAIQIGIISRGGYSSELEYIKKYKYEPAYVLSAFREFVHKGFLSKEFFEGKGHKVLGKTIQNSDDFEIDPDAKVESYKEAYSIKVDQGFIFKDDGKLYYADGYDQIYVGSKEGARNQAKQIKEVLLKLNPECPIVHFRVRKKA